MDLISDVFSDVENRKVDESVIAVSQKNVENIERKMLKYCQKF